MMYVASMRVYISGPIDGHEDQNRAAFEAAAGRIQRLGHTPVLPLAIPAWQHEGICPPGYTTGAGHSSACWLRADLVVMLQCDAITMLSGWERSRGATLEHSVALMTGLPVYHDAARYLQLPGALVEGDAGYTSRWTPAENSPHALLSAALKGSQ